MHKTVTAFGALLLNLFSAVLLAAQAPAPATLVMAGRLLDPRTGNVLSPAAVLILGNSGIDGDTELRDAINAGRIPGPRILASGRKLIPPGAYVQNLNPALATAILQQEFLLLHGADSARQAVRENLFQNADVIKV